MDRAAGAESSAVLVIGVGQRDRGDDAAGPAVAARVAGLHLPGVRVAEQADPAGLLETWEDAALVVVADAVRSGRPPGTVHVLHAAHDALPTAASHGSTHALGLAETVELARALDRLPRDLVVVGIEADHFRPGDPISPQVADAVPEAATVIAEIVSIATEDAPPRNHDM